MIDVTGTSHWGDDPYWTRALEEYSRLRDGGATKIELDLEAIDTIAYAAGSPAFKLMEAMASVIEHEGFEGFRGAPRLMLALLVRLREVTDELGLPR